MRGIGEMKYTGQGTSTRAWLLEGLTYQKAVIDPISCTCVPLGPHCRGRRGLETFIIMYVIDSSCRCSPQELPLLRARIFVQYVALAEASCSDRWRAADAHRPSGLLKSAVMRGVVSRDLAN